MRRTSNPARDGETVSLVPRPAGGAAFPIVARLIPGTMLCLAVSLVATALASLEARVFGRSWLEALVLAILVGTMVRTVWMPGALWIKGIEFSAKILLELAILLLGASLSAQALAAVGPGLLAGIVGVVGVAIAMSYGIGRLLGLRPRMALLVACGNAICGNSAIAAVAPAIGAKAEDVATAIAFTAVLGVATVLGLPGLIPLLHLSGSQYGVLAGLTVYAVPQVLAATVPAGTIAVHIGTLVKLARVLMLGPVLLVLSLIAHRLQDDGEDPGQGAAAGDRLAYRLRLHHLVPWFIVGFLGLAALRSFDYVPHSLLSPMATAANWLTVIAMAALGLGTDLRQVARAGLPVASAVTVSLALIVAISFVLIQFLG